MPGHIHSVYIHRKWFWHGVALAVLFLFLVLIFLPFTPFVMPWPSRDSGSFLYVAQQMLDGEHLYSALWDHKPPVIFYLNVIGLLLADGSYKGVYLVEFTLLSVSVLLSYMTLQRLFGRESAFFATALWIASLSRLLQGNQVEEYALFFQFALLACFAQSEQTGKTRWAILIGVFSACLFFTRQNLIGLTVSVGAVWVIHGITSQKSVRDIQVRFMALLGGGLLASIILLLPIALQGDLGAFWHTAFVYNFLYVETTLTMRFESLVYGIRRVEHSGLGVISSVTWASILVLWRRIPAGWRSVLLLAVIALPTELFFASYSGRLYNHYFIAVLPSAAVLAACFFCWALDVVRTGLRRSESAALAALCAIVLTALVSITSLLRAREMLMSDSMGQMPSQKAALVNYIRSETSSEDIVFIWGAEPGINFFSERDAPEPFAYIYPLYAPQYSTPQLMMDFIAELVENPPVMIIDIASGTDRAMPLNSARRATWLDFIENQPRIRSEVDAEGAVAMLLDYLDANYQVTAEIAGLPVYRPMGDMQTNKQ